MGGARGFAGAAAIIDAAQKANRTLLTEVESKQLLDLTGYRPFLGTSLRVRSKPYDSGRAGAGCCSKALLGNC